LKTRDSILIEKIAIATRTGLDEPFKTLIHIQRLLDEKPQNLMELFEEKIAKKEDLLIPIFWTKNFHPITLDENHLNKAPLFVKTAGNMYDIWKNNLSSLLQNEILKKDNTIYVKWYDNHTKPWLFVAVTTTEE